MIAIRKFLILPIVAVILIIYLQTAQGIFITPTGNTSPAFVYPSMYNIYYSQLSINKL